MPDSFQPRVSVQAEDFDATQLQEQLLGDTAQEGAVVTFTGFVRANNDSRHIQSLTLEHYPGMTQASIRDIALEAGQRWPLLSAGVVHRTGELQPGERIVWVGVASVHREAAFGACEFIMDYLKTRAPFWKKEIGPDGEYWVDARESDTGRAARWS